MLKRCEGVLQPRIAVTVQSIFFPIIIVCLSFFIAFVFILSVGYCFSQILQPFLKVVN